MAPNRLINFAAFTVTSALQPALKLLLLPVFAGLLGPDGMGRIAYIEAIVAFVAVFSAIGLHHFYLRNYHHTDQQTLFSTLTKFLLLYNLVILLACIGAAWLFGDPSQSTSFALASATNFLSVLLILPLRELRLQERAIRYGATYAGAAVAQTLLALVLVSLGFGSLGWFVGYFLGMLPFALYYAVESTPRLRARFEWTVLKDGIKLGGALTISALGMMTVNIADRIQLKSYVNYEQLGLYSVGYALGIGVSIFCTALYTTFEPSLYKHAHHDEGFARSFARSFALSYIVVASIVTLVIVLVVPLGGFILGDRFGPALPIAKVVAACGLYSLCHLYFTLVGIRLQSRRALIIATFVGAALNVLANFLLIPRWGIMGAAYATFGAYFTMTLLYSLVMWRIVALRALYVAALLIPIAILATMSAAETLEGWLAALAPMIAALLGMIWIARAGSILPWMHRTSTLHQ